MRCIGLPKLGKMSNPKLFQKCFANAGFCFYEQTNIDHEENIQNMIDDLSSSIGIECCSSNNYMNIDEEEQLVHAYTDDDWETQLIENFYHQQKMKR